MIKHFAPDVIEPLVHLLPVPGKRRTIAVLLWLPLPGMKKKSRQNARSPEIAKKSSVHNVKSVMNTRYGELHQKRYFRKLRQSKGFRPQAGGFAHAFFTFLGCFECNQKRYFLIFINDVKLLPWMLLTCKLRVIILPLGLFHISSASPIIML